MIIMKFGGTSVGSPQRMKALINLIDNGHPKIVVLSAMSGTTNSLVDIGLALYQKENEKAVKLIESLAKKYSGIIL
ncbi:MAG: aspartate kinase, partial [Bacteroidales bacterium]